MTGRLLLCLLTCSSFYTSLSHPCTQEIYDRISLSNGRMCTQDYSISDSEANITCGLCPGIKCGISIENETLCAKEYQWQQILKAKDKNDCSERNTIVIGVVAIGIVVLVLIVGFGVVIVCMNMRFWNAAGQQNTSPGRKSTHPQFQNPTYSPSSTTAPVQYSSDGPQDIVTRLPRISAAKGALDHTYAAIDSPLENHEENQVPGGQRDDDGHYEELDNVAGEMHDEPASMNEQDMESVPTP